MWHKQEHLVLVCIVYDRNIPFILTRREPVEHWIYL